MTVAPNIANGSRKPSAYGRRGCAICMTGIGRFQFRKIGLCNPCRSTTARELGIAVTKVDVFEADKATWFLSADQAPNRVMETHRLHTLEHGWIFGYPGPAVCHAPSFTRGWTWFVTRRFAIVASDLQIERLP